MSKAVDNSSAQLESLSNSELRAKCIEHGLPNVPVTDSSRNVLIRKLRVSMGGGGAGGPSTTAAVSAPKKTNRRETIHVVSAKPQATAAATDGDGEQAAPNRPPSRPSNRRTIAATMSFTKEQPPNVPVAEVAAAPLPVVTGIPAPIGNRRRSTVREQLASGYVPPLQAAPTVAAPTVAAAAVKSNRQLIILESDEEEEVDLLEAAARAERDNRVILSIHDGTSKSRAASLSKTGVQTTSYQQPSPQLQEEIDNIRSSTMIQTATIKMSQPLPEAVAKRILPPTGGVRYMLSPTASTTQRYSSTHEPAAASYSSPMTRRSVAGGYTTSSSSQATQPLVSSAVGASGYYNEQSDDTDTGGVGDEPIRTPFLSNFARSLERIKAEPLTGDVRPGSLFGSESEQLQRQRHKQRSSKMYEVGGARQPINPQPEESLTESLGQLFNALDRRYHLKRNLAVFVLILFIVFLFVLFWQ